MSRPPHQPSKFLRKETEKKGTGPVKHQQIKSAIIIENLYGKHYSPLPTSDCRANHTGRSRPGGRKQLLAHRGKERLWQMLSHVAQVASRNQRLGMQSQELTRFPSLRAWLCLTVIYWDRDQPLAVVWEPVITSVLPPANTRELSG